MQFFSSNTIISVYVSIVNIIEKFKKFNTEFCVIITYIIVRQIETRIEWLLCLPRNVINEISVYDFWAFFDFEQNEGCIDFTILFKTDL